MTGLSPYSSSIAVMAPHSSGPVSERKQKPLKTVVPCVAVQDVPTYSVVVQARSQWQVP